MNAKITSAIVLALTMTGCASIVHTANEKVSVVTTTPAEDWQTVCDLKNNDGQWIGRPLLPIEINRDSSDMTVTCSSPTGYGKAKVSTTLSAWWLGNIPLFGIFSPVFILVDGLNEADYSYPESIMVPMAPRTSTKQGMK